MTPSDTESDRPPGTAVRPEVIFLIGTRGSGKTTTAKLLADRLGWTWLDADEVLEKGLGKTVRAIFATEGEAAFRDKESAVLQGLCRLMRRCVIATGGGVVLRPENRALLKRHGWCVWLTADVQTLWQRLQDDPNTPERRPALTVGGIEEIADVLRRREALYRECADLTVQTEGRSPDAIVAQIVAEFTRRSAGGGSDAGRPAAAG